MEAGELYQIHLSYLDEIYIVCISGPQTLWERGTVDSFFLRRGPGIIDATVHYRAAARRLRSTGLKQKIKLHGLSPQANYTDWLSDRRLSAKLVLILWIESVAWSAQRFPTAVNFGFLDRSRSFLEIAPQLSSRGGVNTVPDPLLRRKNLVPPGIKSGPLDL
jgi:hypothetical protein